MKTLRAILIAVFLLAVLANSAAASGSTIGFVPLLSEIDPNIPVEVQTQEAMRSIEPQLLAAQLRGEILQFEASLSTGVLKIAYTETGAGPTTLAGKPVYQEMSDAVASVNFPQPVERQSSVPLPSAAGSGYFSMRLYENCFQASGLGASAHVTGSLRDNTGRIVALYDGNADVSGGISLGCFSWSGSYSDVIPGYRVTFKEFSGTGTLVKTYQVFVPAVKFTLIDKTNSIVRGTAPAGKPFKGTWYHRNWNQKNTFINIERNRTTTSTGTWGVDFGTIKIRGNDHLNAIVVMNANFQFDRWMDVPHIYCILGGNYCNISGFAFTPASLKVVHGTSTYNFSGKFGADGYFRAFIETASGNPVFLKTGDKVSGTTIPAFVLPNMSASMTAATDIVSGKAPAQRYFDLWALITSTGTSYKVYSHANSLGNYASNFSSLVDLRSGVPTTFQIFYVHPSTGNAVEYFKAFGP
jgi:hypothetical protein